MWRWRGTTCKKKFMLLRYCSLVTYHCLLYNRVASWLIQGWLSPCYLTAAVYRTRTDNNKGLCRHLHDIYDVYFWLISLLFLCHCLLAPEWIISATTCLRRPTPNICVAEFIYFLWFYKLFIENSFTFGLMYSGKQKVTKLCLTHKEHL